MTLTDNQAAGLASVASIASSIAAGSTSRAQSRIIGESARKNIGFAKNDYMVRSEIAFEQEEAINRELGRVLSERGLKAMIAKSSLVAGAGSTGLSGTSIEEMVDETDYHQILDNQVLFARADVDIVDTYRTRLADYMNFKAGVYNQTMQTKQNVESQANPLISGLKSGLSTFIDYKTITKG